jgi:hypothetical protein
MTIEQNYYVEPTLESAGTFSRFIVRHYESGVVSPVLIVQFEDGDEEVLARAGGL